MSLEINACFNNSSSKDDTTNTESANKSASSFAVKPSEELHILFDASSDPNKEVVKVAPNHQCECNVAILNGKSIFLDQSVGQRTNHTINKENSSTIKTSTNNEILLIAPHNSDGSFLPLDESVSKYPQKPNA